MKSLTNSGTYKTPVLNLKMVEHVYVSVKLNGSLNYTLKDSKNRNKVLVLCGTY
jgi:hypothetical protein